MYIPKDFSSLIGTPGFSDTLLNNHFTLYQGYVKNVNTLLEKLGAAEAGTPEYSELKRRFGWEWNGMRLHELYFGNMNKTASALAPESSLYKKMTASFGSGENCEKDFRNVATLRGIGWVVMYYDTVADRLFNIWVSDHAENHLAGATPLLVMDMWEHAFMIDYGLKKADYIDAFIKAIDWNTVAARLS
ncbi:MAG: Fe-Mn family superoxide dismutase [Patescibacteria group bacterium]